MSALTPEQVLNRLGHEDRFAALVVLADRIENPVHYWKAFRSAWDTSELLSPHHETIEELIQRYPEHRPAMMSLPERRHLRSLPERIKVYRGSCVKDSGWSWSLDRERAEWFARRWPITGEAYVLEGWVYREAVIAYLDGRDEEELVIHPTDVFLTKITDLGPQEMSASQRIGYMVRTGQVGLEEIVAPIPVEYEESYRAFIAELREWGLDELADRHQTKLTRGRELDTRMAEAHG